MLILIPFLFIFSPSAFAQEKKSCDSSAVTRNCDFYKEREDKARITLPDGTFFDNPMVKASSGNKKLSESKERGLPGGGIGGGLDYPNAGPIYEAMLAQQSEVMDLFEGSKLTTPFKMAFSTMVLGQLSFGATDLKLPWPPDQKNAPMTNVKADDVLAYLKDTLDEPHFSALQKIINQNKTKTDELMAEQQKQQQAKMKADHERDVAETKDFENQSKRIQKVSELFKYAQDQVAEVIRKGRKDSELSPTEIELIEKIQRLRLNDPLDPQTALSPTCLNSKENAFYDKQGTVTLCLSLLFHPNASIVGILAHEIGHSVDSCNFQMETWQIDNEKLEKMGQDHKLTSDESAELTDYFKNRKWLEINPDLIINDPNLQKKLAQAGVLKKISEGHSYSEYPFKKEYDCFVKANQFRETSKEDTNDTFQFLNKSVKGDATQKEKSRSVVLRYKSAMKKYPQCFRSITHAGQTQEVMADMMGALVEEKFILENPSRIEEERIGALAGLVEKSVYRTRPS